VLKIISLATTEARTTNGSRHQNTARMATSRRGKASRQNQAYGRFTCQFKGRFFHRKSIFHQRWWKINSRHAYAR